MASSPQTGEDTAVAAEDAATSALADAAQGEGRGAPFNIFKVLDSVNSSSLYRVPKVTSHSYPRMW